MFAVGSVPGRSRSPANGPVGVRAALETSASNHNRHRGRHVSWGYRAASQASLQIRISSRLAAGAPKCASTAARSSSGSRLITSATLRHCPDRARLKARFTAEDFVIARLLARAAGRCERPLPTHLDIVHFKRRSSSTQSFVCSKFKTPGAGSAAVRAAKALSRCSSVGQRQRQRSFPRHLA